MLPFFLASTLVLGETAPPPNGLFQELTKTGVAVSPTIKVPLPTPTLKDGLNAQAQQEAITTLAGQDYTPDDLLRQSVVAPLVLKFRDITPSDKEAPAHGIDLWFIAYGKLETLTKKDFLEGWQNSQKEGKVHVLTETELTKRKLQEKAEPAYEERYTHAVLTILDHVQASATNHTVLTKGTESVLYASEMDPAFAKDPDFPNQWRSMTQDDQGQIQLGSPHPYSGAAAYLKVTRLAQPEGALLVEYHLVFTEPKDWFSGANLLRSKVPILAQSQVRSFRRELEKAK